MSEKFLVSRDHFESNLRRSLNVLKNEEDFQDVTLVTDDLHQVRANKLLLSASSEYFKTILLINKHSHPLLCLDGIRFTELKNILEYIYNGEVRLEQKHLERFINVAKRLKLEGITNEQPETNENVKKKKEVPKKAYEPPLEDNSIIDPGAVKLEEFSDIEENENDINDYLTHTEGEFMEMANEDLEMGYLNDSVNIEPHQPYQTIQKIDEIKEKYEKQEDGTYICKICGKVTKQDSNMKSHIEIHIEGIVYKCPDCP